jgi:hypothetical protein
MKRIDEKKGMSKEERKKERKKEKEARLCSAADACHASRFHHGRHLSLFKRIHTISLFFHLSTAHFAPRPRGAHNYARTHERTHGHARA